MGKRCLDYVFDCFTSSSSDKGFLIEERGKCYLGYVFCYFTSSSGKDSSIYAIGKGCLDQVFGCFSSFSFSGKDFSIEAIGKCYLVQIFCCFTSFFPGKDSSDAKGNFCFDSVFGLSTFSSQSNAYSIKAGCKCCLDSTFGSSTYSSGKIQSIEAGGKCLDGVFSLFTSSSFGKGSSICLIIYSSSSSSSSNNSSGCYLFFVGIALSSLAGSCSFGYQIGLTLQASSSPSNFSGFCAFTCFTICMSLSSNSSSSFSLSSCYFGLFFDFSAGSETFISSSSKNSCVFVLFFSFTNLLPFSSNSSFNFGLLTFLMTYISSYSSISSGLCSSVFLTSYTSSSSNSQASSSRFSISEHDSTLSLVLTLAQGEFASFLNDIFCSSREVKEVIFGMDLSQESELSSLSKLMVSFQIRYNPEMEYYSLGILLKDWGSNLLSDLMADSVLKTAISGFIDLSFLNSFLDCFQLNCILFQYSPLSFLILANSFFSLSLSCPINCLANFSFLSSSLSASISKANAQYLFLFSLTNLLSL